MRVYPFLWHTRPTIRVDIEDRDRARLNGAQPSASDWVARLIARVETDIWKCNASNVIDEGVIYVPQFKGFIPPPREEQEISLRTLMDRVSDTLIAEGFTVG